MMSNRMTLLLALMVGAICVCVILEIASILVTVVAPSMTECHTLAGSLTVGRSIYDVRGMKDVPK